MQIIYWLTNFLCHRQVVMATSNDCTDTREKRKPDARLDAAAQIVSDVIDEIPVGNLGCYWSAIRWNWWKSQVQNSDVSMQILLRPSDHCTPLLVHLIVAWQLSIRNSNIMGGLDERHAPSELQWADYWLQMTKTMRSLVRVKLDNLRNRTQDY